MSDKYLLILEQAAISQTAIDKARTDLDVSTVFMALSAGTTQPELKGVQFIQLDVEETGVSLAGKVGLINGDVVSAATDSPVLALLKAHYDSDEHKTALTYIDALTEPTPASTDNSAASPTTEG